MLTQEHTHTQHACMHVHTHCKSHVNHTLWKSSFFTFQNTVFMAVSTSSLNYLHSSGLPIDFWNPTYSSNYSFMNSTNINWAPTVFQELCWMLKTESEQTVAEAVQSNYIPGLYSDSLFANLSAPILFLNL